MGVSAIIQSNANSATDAVQSFAERIATAAEHVATQAHDVARTTGIVQADVNAHFAVVNNPWRTAALILGAIVVLRWVLK